MIEYVYRVMIARPLAAACAACISHTLFHPFDTHKIVRQMKNISVELDDHTYYSGWVPSASGSFFASGLYFASYENLLKKTEDIALSLSLIHI